MSKSLIGIYKYSAIAVLAILLTACAASDPGDATENSNNGERLDLSQLLDATPVIPTAKVIATETVPAVIQEDMATEVVVLPPESEEPPEDYLVFAVYSHKFAPQTQVFYYDPTTDITRPILQGWDVDVQSISISIKNHLAFSAMKNDKFDVYVLDYPFTQNVPINITKDSAMDNHVMSWSRDGELLLYKSTLGEGGTLSIWDERTAFNIYDYKDRVIEFDWSHDGRLAFTDYSFIDPSSGEESDEVLFWDGESTISVSQNPTGVDRFPAWSSDGQLAFLSKRYDKYDIFVWDGVSKIDGLPDVDSFFIVAPEYTYYGSWPIWTNEGNIAFGGGNDGDGYITIYEWDGSAVTNISQNAGIHNGGQSWNSNGQWSFVTFWSSEQLIYVRDQNNKTLLSTEGYSGGSWSTNGYLAFCTAPWWTMSIWNRISVKEIVKGDVIRAQWKNGNDVYCSSG